MFEDIHLTKLGRHNLSCIELAVSLLFVLTLPRGSFTCKTRAAFPLQAHRPASTRHGWASSQHPGSLYPFRYGITVRLAKLIYYISLLTFPPV